MADTTATILLAQAITHFSDGRVIKNVFYYFGQPYTEEKIIVNRPFSLELTRINFPAMKSGNTHDNPNRPFGGVDFKSDAPFAPLLTGRKLRVSANA
jgi:hypothetical protein